jgi:hypothetical protein
MSVRVRGVDRATGVILRAGERAGHQASSLRAAEAEARAVDQGPWQNRSGRLTGSLDRVDADDSGLLVASDVPYARFVFYGTSRQAPRPPEVNDDALVSAVLRNVANDLVGE